MLMVRTELRPSGIHGIGVFLAEPVRAGQTIWRFDSRIDRVFSDQELAELPDLMQDFLRTYSTLDAERRLWLLCGDNGRHFNHSDRPNTRSLGQGATALPTKDGFSVGIVISTPPFPLSRKDVEAPVGLPLLIGDIEDDNLHLGEVGLEQGELVTSGLYGWTAVVTGTGPTAEQAKAAAYDRVHRIQTQNMRYRLDIGDKLMNGQLQQLIDWGWIKSIPPSRIASQIVR